MWNTFSTDDDGGMTARVEMITGGTGTPIRAYVARPDGDELRPGIVLIPHAPGWDEFMRETARRFAEHGFITICPNIFERFGHGMPADVAARVRTMGGISDAEVVAHGEASLKWIKALPTSNGKVGVIGMCSGGRHSVLTASRVPAFNAVADLWGGNVVMAPSALNANTPVAPIDLTRQLNAPLIGIFGNDDTGPSPDQVNQHEAALKAAGKTYTFHRYDGAGHGIFYYDRPNYRIQAAMDAWDKVLNFFTETLA